LLVRWLHAAGSLPGTLDVGPSIYIGQGPQTYLDVRAQQSIPRNIFRRALIYAGIKD
jgi:hypothetical protein